MKLFSSPNVITRCLESKAYFRRLVVRAIEDAILLVCVFIGIGGVCAVCSLLLKILGVQ